MVISRKVGTKLGFGGNVIWCRARDNLLKDGLTPGTNYAFQTRAIGGSSGFSDIDSGRRSDRLLR